MEKKASINVVAAVICEDKKFLIAQRGRRKDYGLLWEFPGGKVEQGETLEEALLREIKEEIDVKIVIEKKILTVPFADDSLDILLHYYLCKKIGEIKLLEHENALWITKSEFLNFNMVPGDSQVINAL